MLQLTSAYGIRLDDGPSNSPVVNGQLQGLGLTLQPRPTLPRAAAVDPDVVAMRNAAAPLLAPCAPGADCGNVSNRVSDPGSFELPPGTIVTNLGRFYAYWHINQFQDLGKGVSQFIPDYKVGPEGMQSLLEAWNRQVAFSERWPKFNPASRAFKKVYLWTCASWCRGCQSPIFPQGAPKCTKQVKVEHDNYEWGMFLNRQSASTVEGGGTRVTLKRLPKGTWDYVEDAAAVVSWPFKQVSEWLCANYNQPSAQAAESAVSSYSGEIASAAVSYGNYILRQGCGGGGPLPSPPKPPAPPAPVQTLFKPPAPAPTPFYKKWQTYAIAGGAVAAIGGGLMFARRGR